MAGISVEPAHVGVSWLDGELALAPLGRCNLGLEVVGGGWIRLNIVREVLSHR